MEMNPNLLGSLRIMDKIFFSFCKKKIKFFNYLNFLKSYNVFIFSFCVKPSGFDTYQEEAGVVYNKYILYNLFKDGSQ